MLPYHTDECEFALRVLETVNNLSTFSFEKFISGFFLMSDFDEVHIENFHSFLCWMMYNKHLEDATDNEMENLRTVASTACRLYPKLRELKPGFNPKVRHVGYSLEPVPVIHRPLFLYVFVGISEVVANVILLRICGFRNLEMDGTTYWYRQSRHPQARNNPPLLFLHGISPGWSLYVQFVRSLGRNRDLILVDLDAIKIKSLNFYMPTPDQFCRSILRILKRHGIEKVSVAGHSFGSITAGWLVTNHPEVVSHLTLIDPVSMLLCLPAVVYSFLYRPPTNFMEWLIYAGASRELTISYTLRRQFWWYKNTLWLEDVPDHIGVVVGLAEGDEITNARVLQEYVQQCRARRLRSHPDSLYSMSSNNSKGNAIAGNNDSVFLNKAKNDVHSYSAVTTVPNSTTTMRLESLPTSRSTRSMVALTMANNQQLQRNIVGNRGTYTSIYCSREKQEHQVQEQKDVAMIECVYWDNFSHGQVLALSAQQKEFISTIHRNEKLSVKY